MELSGTGYEPVGEVTITGDEPRVRCEAERALAAGSLANNAQLARVDGVWEVQGDPTEAAFLVAQHKVDGVPERVGAWERISEVPFTSERKMMSVLGRRTADEHVRLFAKGAPDVLLERCTAELAGGDVVPLSDQRRAQIDADIERLSSEGYRTLGVAAAVPSGRIPAPSRRMLNVTWCTSASSASSTRPVPRPSRPSPRRTAPASAPS